ncbi:MAG: DNA-processing protein DprA, partial [Acidimicrobiales bacterium]
VRLGAGLHPDPRLLAAGPAVTSTRRGRPAREELARCWREASRAMDPAVLAGAYAAAGVEVHVRGVSQRYPGCLAADPSAPAILCSRGRPQWLDGLPRAAIVGTRSATPYGLDVAEELGAGLAEAGVVVVSGLALGIDGAAHRGAVRSGGAPPLGIVGSGLGVVYPQRHERLWERVAERGALLSEAPLRARPEPWRFPWRNRLIAAASQVVVVVESHRGGGSLLTVEAAARRGVSVLAVPGSVRSPASAGTNALLAEGCAPARDVSDVLVAIGLSGGPSTGGPSTGGPSTGGPSTGGPAASRRRPVGPDADVLGAVEDVPTTLETVLRRTGAPAAAAALALDRLVEGGWLRGGDGWWSRV